ncbi:MAG TPA: porin [Steroidobacteraceae bacterium]|nr:porin [Steroidobacteraceae bacterium]
MTRQSNSTSDPNRSVTVLRTALWSAGLIACTALQAYAADAPAVSVGAGMRTSYTHDAPDGGSDTDAFSLDSIRLYINGSVTQDIKFTFNTEYTGAANTVQVMDSIARFEFNDKFNIWAGRFLPPSDRANLYGPYYANDWNPYADGVADFYPNVAVGRDNGVAYWGQFGILKVQAGVFDGASLKDGKDGLLTAARLMLDFWDPEGGYYLNGTYYGDKDLLAVGVAGQMQGGVKSTSGDFLLEKKLSSGAFTVEAEYQKDDGLIQNPAGAGINFTESKGYYGLVAYTFPEISGVGKFQPLLKYSKKTYTDVNATYPDTDVKTTEFDLNYIIKGFNARVSLFYLSQKAEPSAPVPSTTDNKFGLGVQLQM